VSLAAAQVAGGDSRGQSAAVLVVERDGGYAGLRTSCRSVDDHEILIEELRAHGLHDQLFGRTPRPVASRRRRAADRNRRATTSSARASRGLAGAVNLEERVDGADEIDPVVLNELRRSE
jgi:uncharacterized Ntn-hydrolase superfamily protein